MKKLFLIGLGIFSLSLSFSQGCCSGGAGSPLSGGAATGVLQKGQMEVAFTHQYFQSNKFFVRDSDTTALFSKLSSNYMYLRADYGITDKLTFSLSSGYFIDKSLVELDMETVNKSSGLGDLIVFPRYSLFSESEGKSSTELSVGLGFKIPLGAHNDSSLVFTNPQSGQEYYSISPPTIQTTNGSNDFMFYSFFYKGFPHRKFRFFTNALYIKKGWNSLGQKFGDYMSVGLFAGTTLFKGVGLTGQIKGEYITKMKAHDDINMLALYNIDMTSTGSKKIFFVPQISYTFRSFSVFALAEIPLYQYMEGTQVGSQHQYTAGISYRFFVKEPEIDSVIVIESAITDIDPDNCQQQEFKVWGNCEMCEDKIESNLLKTTGVLMADWNIESKMLIVEFDHNLITMNEIKLKIASLGYDTETHRASKKVYKKLHGCCQYERPE